MRGLILGLLKELKGYLVDLGGSPRGRDAYSLTAHLELQSQVGSERGKASVLVSLELRPLDQGPDAPGFLRNGLSEKVYRVQKLQSLETLYLDLLRSAAGELLRQMSTERRLRTAPPAVLVHAISSSRLQELDQGWTDRVDPWQPMAIAGLLTALGDVGIPAAMTALIMGRSTPDTGVGSSADVREMAIKAAAFRKLREAVPQILAVLSRERRQRVRDLCLGALAEIRDPVAVAPLVRYARQGDLRRLRKVIGVVGVIGGKEARAFLEITADGHDDEEIQKLARETLERLERQ